MQQKQGKLRVDSREKKLGLKLARPVCRNRRFTETKKSVTTHPKNKFMSGFGAVEGILGAGPGTAH